MKDPPLVNTDRDLQSRHRTTLEDLKKWFSEPHFPRSKPKYHIPKPDQKPET